MDFAALKKFIQGAPKTLTSYLTISSEDTIQIVDLTQEKWSTFEEETQLRYAKIIERYLRHALATPGAKTLHDVWVKVREKLEESQKKTKVKPKVKVSVKPAGEFKLENKEVEFWTNLPLNINDWTWEQKYMFWDKLLSETDLNRLFNAAVAASDPTTKSTVEQAQTALNTARTNLRTAIDDVMTKLNARLIGEKREGSNVVLVLQEEERKSFQEKYAAVRAAQEKLWNAELSNDMFQFAMDPNTSVFQQLRRARSIPSKKITFIIRYLININFLEEVGLNKNQAQFSGKPVERLQNAITKIDTWLQTDVAQGKNTQCASDLDVDDKYKELLAQYVKLEKRHIGNFAISQKDFEKELKLWNESKDNLPYPIPKFLKDQLFDEQLKRKFPKLVMPASYAFDGLCPTGYMRVGSCCLWNKSSSLGFRHKARAIINFYRKMQKHYRLNVIPYIYKYLELVDSLTDQKGNIRKLDTEASESLQVINSESNTGVVELWNSVNHIVALRPNEPQTFFNFLYGFILYNLAIYLSKIFDEQYGFFYKMNAEQRKARDKAKLDKEEAAKEKEAKKEEAKKEEAEKIAAKKRAEGISIVVREAKPVSESIKPNQGALFFFSTDAIKTTTFEDNPVANKLVCIWFLSLHLKWFIGKAFELWQRQICRQIAVLVSVNKTNTLDFLVQHVDIVIGLLTNTEAMNGFLSRSWAQFEATVPVVGDNDMMFVFRNQLREIEQMILSEVSGCFAKMLQSDPRNTMAQFFHMCSGRPDTFKLEVPKDFQNIVDDIIHSASTAEEDFDTIQHKVNLAKSAVELETRFGLKPQNAASRPVADKDTTEKQYLDLLKTEVPVSSTMSKVLEAASNSRAQTMAFLYGTGSVIYRLLLGGRPYTAAPPSEKPSEEEEEAKHA